MVGRGEDVGIFVCEDAQCLDGTARHAHRPFPFINVLDEHRCLFAIRLDFGRDNRRRLALDEWDGSGQPFARLFGDEGQVVEHVDQIDTPQCVFGRLTGDQEILLAEGKRLHELRPDTLDQFVFDDGDNLSVFKRKLLNHALLLFAALGRVEDDETARTRRPVMPGDDADEAAVVFRNRFHVEDAVREERAAAVERLVFRSVRVHVHDDAGEIVRQVSIFPAGVHDASVRDDDGRPVTVLIEC